MENLLERQQTSPHLCYDELGRAKCEHSGRTQAIPLELRRNGTMFRCYYCRYRHVFIRLTVHYGVLIYVAVCKSTAGLANTHRPIYLLLY